MARYIDADVLLELIDEFEPENWTNSDRELQAVNDFELFRSLVKAEPTADVVEVKHSEWILHKDGSGTCKQCGFTQKNVWDYDNWQNFCGHCGAKMDGKGDSE